MNVRQEVWKKIRELQIVSQPSLLILIRPKKEDDGNICIGRYLYRLYCVGILNRSRNRRGIYQYTLANDIGPLAPVARAHEVYDPNDDRFYDFIAERVDDQLTTIRNARNGKKAHAAA